VSGANVILPCWELKALLQIP